VLNILNEDEQIRKVFFRTLRTNQNNFLKIKGRKTYLLNNENVVQDLRTQFLTFLNSEEFSKNSIIVPKGNNTFKINVERLNHAKQKKLSTKDDVEQLLIYLGLPRVTISEHVVPQVIDKTMSLL
jgi:3-dehydroquinate synthetase